MLPFLHASDRKLRLFGCACYYRVCHLLPSEVANLAVETAERFADSLVGPKVLSVVHNDIRGATQDFEDYWRRSRGAEHIAALPAHAALALACQVTDPDASWAARHSPTNASWTIAAIMNPGAAAYDASFLASEKTEKKAQAELVRCIFGNPFRPQPPLDASLLTEAVVGLATQIYDQRSFDRMPDLAELLEKEGCEDMTLLEHMRGTGPHARGCFALDAVLGKS
jgi:hypothetical protein